VLLKRAVLTAGIVMATALPAAGTAMAGPTAAAGHITATDSSAGAPALVALDPADGTVVATLAQNAEDGVVSPKGSSVAYIQRTTTCVPQTEGCVYPRDLVLAKADGSDRHVLVPGIAPETGEAPYVGHPDWSPDGRRLVYDSPRGLEWINTDGTGQEVLTPAAGPGTFSPDGRSIAFVRTTSYETADGGWEQSRDVWTLDTTTRALRQITTTHDAVQAPVDWSPDGTRIAYATTNGLNVTDAASGTTTPLQTTWTTPLTGVQSPVFSPDGTRIAFSATDAFTYTTNTYTTDATGTGTPQLLRSPSATPTDWLNR
jgi:TolB protein